MPLHELDLDTAIVVAYGLILAAGDFGCAKIWLLEFTRIALAALARRRADPAGDHGG